MRAIIGLFLLAGLVAAIVWLWPRLEGDAPVLSGPERVELGADSQRVEVAWEDAGMGLLRVSAVVRLPSSGSEEAEEITLFEKRFKSLRPGDPVKPAAAEQQALELDAAALGLPDGESTLVLRAQDASWSGFGDGNLAERSIPVIVDTQPPRVSVQSGLTYVRRGGSALVAYRVDADAARSGVRVGDAFFPGLARSGGSHVAIFAVPVEASAAPGIEVVAIDAFGNEATARFDARIQDRVVPEISISLSESFLGRVAGTFGGDGERAGPTPLAIFQRTNTALRAQNEAVIVDAIPSPSEPKWSGAFGQMRNSKVTSEFAELRNYTYAGRRVSRARHYGYDLASTSRASITASNGGTVIFAGDNGIYGTLVMIDHGLGITTLYGHLSSLEVEVGDRVERGQLLGRSGATGLAGGDHLHYAVLVGRTYVDPLEWWDPKWVREHIETRLGAEVVAAGAPTP